MASILSSAMITNAQGSVNTYINTANQLYSELQSIINNLTADGFQGDAANGYRDFFQNKATPALGPNLTEPTGSLTAASTACSTPSRSSCSTPLTPVSASSTRIQVRARNS